MRIQDAPWIQMSSSSRHSHYSSKFQIRFFETCQRCFLTSSFINTVYTVSLVTCLVVPIALVVSAYLAIGGALLHRSITSTRFLVTASIIILSGVVTTLPWVVLEVSEVTIDRTVYIPLVTVLPFLNSVLDPLVYIIANPNIKTLPSSLTVDRKSTPN